MLNIKTKIDWIIIIVQFNIGHIPPEVEQTLPLYTLKYGVPVPVCTTGTLVHNSGKCGLFLTVRAQTH
jgi:hypothetical protein